MNRMKFKAKGGVSPSSMTKPKTSASAMGKMKTNPTVPMNKAQKMPSTPPSKAEKGTSKPSSSRKMEMPPAPQPVPQNVKRKKGVM